MISLNAPEHPFQSIAQGLTFFKVEGRILFQGVACRVMSWMQPFFKGCKAPADPFHHGVPGACFSTAFGIATNHEIGAE